VFLSGCKSFGGFANMTSVHLVVDSAVALLNLESTAISPSSVPRVDTEPVVSTSIVTPAYDFDGMSA